MRKVFDDQDNVLFYCYAGQHKAVYWEYVCCLRPLQTGCLDLCWILQAGGDKVFPEYAIIYRRQYDKTKVRSCEVMQMGDSACILQGCFIPFPDISWLSLWIGLLLETGSFLHFVLDSATGHIKLENPLKTTAQSMVSSLPSHMPSKPISLRFGRVVILPIRYILD